MSEGAAAKPGQVADFQAALERAREREAARRGAESDIRDLETLRLFVLKQDVAAALPQERAEGGIDLQLVPGDPPRLWADLITFVEMAPDPRTYRLLRDSRDGREVLLETRDRSAAAARIVELAAHRLIARERALSVEGRPARGRDVMLSGALVALVWLSGFVLGIITLFILRAVLERPLW